jgi:hypothetical protein
MLRHALIVIWLATVTLTMQFWVGGQTIYANDNAARVAEAHTQILTNTPPTGGWSSQGMNSVNIRIGAVWLGEQVHRLTGLSILHSYFVVDTVMLFLGLLLLLRYLGRFVEKLYAIVTVSFICSALPLTYQLFWQHPWDRLSFVLWVLVCMLLHREQWLGALALMAVSILVKYDIIVLPGIVALYGLLRDRTLSVKPIAWTTAMFGVTLGVFVGLRSLLPGGFAAHPANYAAELMASNIAAMRSMNAHWPPLLGFLLPFSLAALGMRTSAPWVRAGVIFGVLMFVPFALRSNLAEYRAQTPVLVLIGPAMALGVRHAFRVMSSEPPDPMAPARHV